MKDAIVILLSIVSQSVLSDEMQPIIDVHIHSYGEVSEFGAYGERGPHGLEGSKSQAEHIQETFERFRKYNIVKAVVSGSPDSLKAWKAADDDNRIITGLMIDAPNDYGINVEKFEHLIQSGAVQVYGELGPYYSGTRLADPVWQEYLEICERYGVPVAVHTGGGPPGGTYGQHPHSRLSLGDPYLLEDVLVKYPKLRIYMMHAGIEWHEHTLRLMVNYPQVYADISVLLWVDPSLQRYAREFLRNAKEVGILDRVMFGSDQMRWPDAIDLSIEYLNSLDFLDEAEKRAIFYDNAARFFEVEIKAPSNESSKREVVAGAPS